VRCTKSITVATAKAVAAGNSCKQEDIIVAANMGRKAISDMLTTCKVTYTDKFFIFSSLRPSSLKYVTISKRLHPYTLSNF